MAFEEDGKFNRKNFEETQLPGFLARFPNQEHVTHCAGKTITIHADGTFTVSNRAHALPEEVVVPQGIPEHLQLPPAPHHGPKELVRHSAAPNRRHGSHVKGRRGAPLHEGEAE